MENNNQEAKPNKRKTIIIFLTLLIIILISFGGYLYYKNKNMKNNINDQDKTKINTQTDIQDETNINNEINNQEENDKEIDNSKENSKENTNDSALLFEYNIWSDPAPEECYENKKCQIFNYNKNGIKFVVEFNNIEKTPTEYNEEIYSYDLIVNGKKIKRVVNSYDFRSKYQIVNDCLLYNEYEDVFYHNSLLIDGKGNVITDFKEYGASSAVYYDDRHYIAINKIIGDETSGTEMYFEDEAKLDDVLVHYLKAQVVNGKIEITGEYKFTVKDEIDDYFAENDECKKECGKTYDKTCIKKYWQGN